MITISKNDFSNGGNDPTGGEGGGGRAIKMIAAIGLAVILISTGCSIKKKEDPNAAQNLLESLKALPDSDNDGIPDEMERRPVCTLYRDIAFSEFTNELSKHQSDIIANRNQQYYEYKLAALKINGFVKVSGYEIRENDKNKEQCFNVITNDLKHYFISYNLIN